MAGVRIDAAGHVQRARAAEAFVEVVSGGPFAL